MKMKDWLEEQEHGTTDVCLACEVSLEDVVDVSDGVCGVCIATQ